MSFCLFSCGVATFIVRGVGVTGGCASSIGDVIIGGKFKQIWKFILAHDLCGFR